MPLPRTPPLPMLCYFPCIKFCICIKLDSWDSTKFQELIYLNTAFTESPNVYKSEIYYTISYSLPLLLYQVHILRRINCLHWEKEKKPTRVPTNASQHGGTFFAAQILQKNMKYQVQNCKLACLSKTSWILVIFFSYLKHKFEVLFFWQRIREQKIWGKSGSLFIFCPKAHCIHLAMMMVEISHNLENVSSCHYLLHAQSWTMTHI